MNDHPALVDLSETLITNPDRYEAHDKVKPTVEQLCQDRDFLHDALKGYLADPKMLWEADYLAIPLLHSGDVIVQINLFCPVRDGGKDITHDNIHHHGWRLLTTGVMSGDGYETINFTHGSHENRDGDKVNLKVEEIYRLTTLPTLDDRFVLPPYHREQGPEAQGDPLARKGEAGLGYLQPPARGS